MFAIVNIAYYLGGPKITMGSPYSYNFGDVGSVKLWGPQIFMTTGATSFVIEEKGEEKGEEDD